MLNNRSVSDFLRIRDYFNMVFNGKERFLATNSYCASGKLQEVQDGESLTFVANVTFIEREKATQSDKDSEVDLHSDGIFGEVGFPFIISALSRINTGEMMTTTQEPLLVHIESDSGMAAETKGGKTVYQLSIKVRAADAEHFDSIRRKPFNPENLPSGAMMGTVKDVPNG